MKDRIAILLPCYNEAQTIGKVIADFHAALPEAGIYGNEPAGLDAGFIWRG